MASEIPPILIVDDDASVLLTLRTVLQTAGFRRILTCPDSRQVMSLLSEQVFELLLLDLKMPYVSGLELLPGIRRKYPDLPVVVITGTTEIATAIECMKMGVVDYLVKAVEASKLVATVRRIAEIRNLTHEVLSLKNRFLEGQLQHPEAFSSIVAADERTHAIFKYIDAIAATQHPVLITGETGVGKELFARAVHAASGREGRLVAVNVAEYDEQMFNDALFGHVKGAYTGADQPRAGLVGRAVGGTLFLDEIGNLRLESQVKLLRLLENHEYYPLGSDTPEQSQARVVVATNKDLGKEVGAGRFRDDLYFRLRTHNICIPPLRHRLRDLPVLTEHFVRQTARELGKKAPGIPAQLHALLRSYGFPGNVRELRSMIVDAVSQADGEVLPTGVFERYLGAGWAAEGENVSEALFANVAHLPTLNQAVQSLIEEAMKRANSNQAAAAKILGVSPQTLSYRLKRLGLHRKQQPIRSLFEDDLQ